MKEVLRAVRSRQLRHCGGCRTSFRRSRTWYTPFVLGLRRMSGLRSHHRPSWSSIRSATTTLRRDGRRAVYRLITNSIRFLTNHTSTISVWSTWASSNQQITLAPHLYVLYALSFLPSYVSLYTTWNSSLSLAYRTRTPAPRSTYILPRQVG